ESLALIEQRSVAGDRIDGPGLQEKRRAGGTLEAGNARSRFASPDRGARVFAQICSKRGRKQRRGCGRGLHVANASVEGISEYDSLQSGRVARHPTGYDGHTRPRLDVPT